MNHVMDLPTACFRALLPRAAALGTDRSVLSQGGSGTWNSFDLLLLGGVMALPIARQGMLMRRVGARP